MLEITCNDRLGKKVRVKCNPDDTVGDLKKLIAAQTGTRWDKIVLKKWYTTFKDHIQLQDCILYLPVLHNWVFVQGDTKIEAASSRAYFTCSNMTKSLLRFDNCGMLVEL